MTPIHRSKASVAAIAGLVALVLVLAWLVISGSGLLPGDNGVEAIADPTEGQTGQLMNLGAWPWTIIVVLATAALGAGIAWAQYRSSKVTPAESARTEHATRELHEQERDPAFKD